MNGFSRIALLVALMGIFSSAPAQAQQELTPRFGLGFNTVISTQDGLGMGLRFRGSAPVNQDLSFAIDLGATGFVLEGRDEATYLIDPQISAIVTLPYGTERGRLTYFMGGLGAYLPFNGNGASNNAAPTMHMGLGRVQSLTETSFFYEVNPALVVGQSSVDLILPVRVGVIF